MARGSNKNFEKLKNFQFWQIFLLLFLKKFIIFRNFQSFWLKKCSFRCPRWQIAEFDDTKKYPAGIAWVGEFRSEEFSPLLPGLLFFKIKQFLCKNTRWCGQLSHPKGILRACFARQSRTWRSLAIALVSGVRSDFSQRDERQYKDLEIKGLDLSF